MREDFHSDADFIKKGENYLLPRVCWEIEHENCEEGNSHTGNDQINRVEQSLPPHGEDEGDVGQELLLVPLLAASVLVLVHLRVVGLDVLGGRHVQDVPLHAEVELGQVNAELHHVVAGLLVHVLQINLEKIGR